MKATDLIKSALCIAMLAGLAACGAKSTNAADSDNTATEATQEVAAAGMADTTLVRTVYDTFVFAIDSDGSANPADYFTPKALKALEEAYEYDCEEGGCYAFYELRTSNQDSKPGTEGESFVDVIQDLGGGWYAVMYSDMGWEGVTLVKIADGKIDEYQRMVKKED